MLIDRTGQRVGRLVVLRRVIGQGWLCRCACGTEKIIGSLIRIRSCGCLKREELVARSTLHNRTATPEHNSWLGMRQRCYYKRHKDYRYYGGRGIRVCQPWRDSFAAFFADVGLKPSPKHTLDRIDSDGHYEPGNVRWADHFAQASNRSNRVSVTLDTGEVVCLKEAARRFGADYGAVRYAVKYAAHREPPLDACKRLGDHW